MQFAPAVFGTLLAAASLAQAPVLGPDSQLNPAVPQGAVTQGSFTSTHAYPGSVRDFWVYTPKQLDPAKPSALVVFLDGGGYVKRDGNHRATVVLDNLIAKGTLPPTIGLFVNPGSVPADDPAAKPRAQRSLEYDTPDTTYVNFLVEELMPVVLKGVNLSANPAARAICGSSSGGIAAFTAAWHRPDQFGRVYSIIGSYTNIRGGYRYPELVRDSKAQPKPIRVFLQENRSDLDNLHGHWPLGNQDLAKALAFAGYDHRMEWDEGGHDARPGGVRLPEALAWLFRDASK